ncbi:MAG: FtsQ-type POTRA domain-containing protein [Clostridia bacterium]|nr:FtsQ-type POTRA domain-containing protein [Clostridia bacterium]
MHDTAREIAAATLSKKAYDRRMRRLQRIRLIRAVVLICFFLSVLLLMASIQVNRIKIESVVFDGNLHYSDDALKEALTLQVGDKMYRFDTQTVADALLAACPYLQTAQIQTSLSGTLRVHVSERTALWALQYTDAQGQAAYVLLDGELFALEYTKSAAESCVVVVGGIALPAVGETLTEAAKRAEREYAAWLEAQEAEDTHTVPSYLAAADKLGSMLYTLRDSYEDMAAADAPTLLSLTQDFDKTMTLRDGTIYLLGGAEQLSRQIAYAKAAVEKYRREGATPSINSPLEVDLRDLSRVFVRQIPSIE